MAPVVAVAGLGCVCFEVSWTEPELVAAAAVVERAVAAVAAFEDVAAVVVAVVAVVAFEGDAVAAAVLVVALAVVLVVELGLGVEPIGALIGQKTASVISNIVWSCVVTYVRRSGNTKNNITKKLPH